MFIHVQIGCEKKNDNNKCYPQCVKDGGVEKRWVKNCDSHSDII